MSKFIFFILFFQLLNWNISAQDNIQFMQMNINEILKLENELGSTFKDSSELKLPINPLNDTLGDMSTLGVIYERITESFPIKLNVWYLFEDNSSTTSAVMYNWGLYNPSFNANENRELLIELNKQESQFQQLFDNLFNLTQKEFGEPTEQLTNIDKPHRIVQAYAWDTKNAIIQLKLDFSREIQEFPGIGLQTNNFEVSLLTIKKII